MNAVAFGIRHCDTNAGFCNAVWHRHDFATRNPGTPAPAKAILLPLGQMPIGTNLAAPRTGGL